MAPKAVIPSDVHANGKFSLLSHGRRSKAPVAGDIQDIPGRQSGNA